MVLFDAIWHQIVLKNQSMLLTTQIPRWSAKAKNVSFVLLLLKICLVFGQVEPLKKTILIDVGHGGTDTGAIGINGIKEKDVVLNIAMEILRLNRTVMKGEHDIYLTRYRDTLISLRDRSRLAKSLNADVIVSIHCNASPNNAKGLEVYVHNTKNNNTKKSIVLGELINKEITQNLGYRTRGIKLANFQVLRETRNISASILVETGFITQVDEADYLTKQKNRRAIALAILQGTRIYLEIL